MGGRRLGILGGTFDPIHKGHLALADAVAHDLGLHTVLFIPTGHPHFKLDQHVTPAHQRADMVRIAIADDPRFVLDLREVERPGVTYTADTLADLHAENPDAHLYFIIGADSAMTLVHWRDADRLSKLATFVVARRPGVDCEKVKRAHVECPVHFDLLFVDVPQIDVSSTEARARIAEGKSVADLLPDGVIDYIERNGLYQMGDVACGA